MIKEEVLPGSLSVIKLSDNETDMLIKYYSLKNPQLDSDFLWALMGDNWLEWVDVLAGRKIVVPSRESVLKDIGNIKLYNYCKNRDFTDESIDSATSIFDKKRKISTRNLVKRIGKTIDPNLFLDE